VNTVLKNVLLWIVIVLVMLAVYSRYSSINKTAARGTASASCVTSGTGALICPPPSGSIVLDATGNPVCGRGQCLRAPNGRWMCSTEAGGHAGFKGSAGIACTGGCEAAARELCEMAQ
jgi:hypothetical protein